MAKPLQILVFLLLLLTGTVAQAAPRCPLTGDARMAVGNRSVLVHLPRGQMPDTPAPLVILLHGSGGTGAAMLRDSNLADAADRHGFIVVAPDAGIVHDKGFVWNIPGVPTVAGNIPGPDAPDDVAFIGATIDQLATQGCVDPARVYATGLSGGGRMTSWLGCVAAERFAAIAPVVGLRAGNPLASDPARPDPATCRPSRPMPVITFAGDADTTNPIQGGGTKYWSYTMHAAEQRWAALNGCTAAPTTRWVAPKVYEERYTACRGGADVAGRITVGGGHSWVVDNDALWAFLSQHRR
ncbi:MULTISPECIES: alpha/beta hydrolase family esterase [unclassified Sphingomonas]|uniref:alpha/beta hydrolase family esterase n=1 Tax=unclassified Sphingomonas TaxID=196159 RepID=UPI00070220C2|nr:MULTISPECIES: PHB depolymerase family esterase [unclassified Sphingomonas]KQM60039.1 polyhydroxybutyrate depolymerase [Sphingomonas sp. Leaf16]KQN11437.1 polyhydroxybutyrate depolymerase [Sphingomonas sp. Leaf29]KQN18758.1 polyhydroxybutyrate depolymerase [Sphingomonas sp. Leaf32]